MAEKTESKEGMQKETHFIDILYCDRLGTGKKECPFQNDITIITENCEVHVLATICEKQMAVNKNMLFCNGIKRARITAVIDFKPLK